MRKANIIRGSRSMKSKTDWKRIKNMSDDDIDYSDIPPLDANFWKNAKLIMPEPKVSLGIRFDRDVVNWFKKQGPGYQSRMNAVLKTYIEAQKSLAVRKQKHRRAAS